MISLDVTSLYTNVPKTLVISAIRNRWNDIAPNTLFSLDQFIHALEFVIDSTSFKFDDVYYEQIFGMPMGSPLSPILSDLVMDDLESHCLNSLPFNITTYVRYVDDIFAIVPKEHINDIVQCFNNYHTIEIYV